MANRMFEFRAAPPPFAAAPAPYQVPHREMHLHSRDLSGLCVHKRGRHSPGTSDKWPQTGLPGRSFAGQIETVTEVAILMAGKPNGRTVQGGVGIRPI